MKAAWIVSSHPDIEAIAIINAEASDRTVLLQRALQALPPQERDAILLRDVHGLSYKEAAGVIGKTPGAFKVFLFRSRTRLRKLLEDEDLSKSS